MPFKIIKPKEYLFSKTVRVGLRWDDVDRSSAIFTECSNGEYTMIKPISFLEWVKIKLWKILK